jgi:hypothetical protein
MTELTGLDSILERSHFKTERKNKYSFGKSQRFTPLKSSYFGFNLGTLSIFSTNQSQEIQEHALLAMAVSTSLRLHLIILVLQPIKYQNQKDQGYHLVLVEM